MRTINTKGLQSRCISRVLLLGLLVAPGAVAGTVTWTNPAGGAWGVGANWSTGLVPTNQDDVVLGDLGQPYTVEAGAPDQTAKSISIDPTATLWVQIKNMIVQESVQNAGTLRLESIVANATIALTVVDAAQGITNTGTIEINKGGGGARRMTAALANTGTFVVETGTTCDLINTDRALVQSAGTITVDGDLRVTNGLVQIAGGSVSGGAGLSLSGGQFELAGGQVGVPVSIDNCGIALLSPDGIELTATRACTLTSGLAIGQSIRIQGDSFLGGATLTSATGFSNAGTLTLDSAGNAQQASLTVQDPLAPIVNTGAINVLPGTGGGRTIAASIDNQGTFNCEAGTLCYFPNSGRTFRQLSGGLNVQGALVFEFGRFELVAGAVTGTPQIDRGEISLAGTDPISLLATRGCTLTSGLAMGQSIRVQGNSSLGAASLTSTGGFANAGTLTLDSADNAQAASLTVQDTADPIVNTGTIQVLAGSGGTRTIAASIDNAGTFSCEAGAVCQLSNSQRVFRQLSGVLDVGGSLVFDLGRFDFVAGTVIGTPRVDRCEISLAGTDPISLLATRACTLTSGLASGQSIRVQGNSTVGDASLTSAGGFENAGTLTLDTIDSARSVSLTVQELADPIVNTGTIQVLAGTGGGRTMAASVDNQGTFFCQTGTVCTFANDQRTFRQLAGALNVPGRVRFDLGSFAFAAGIVTGIPEVDRCSISLTGTDPIDLVAFRNCTLTSGLASGQSITVQGNSTFGNASLTSASGFSNAGTLTLDSVDSTWSASLAVQDPSGSIANTGAIEVLTGAGGSRTITAGITNRGSILVEPTCTITNANRTFAQESGSLAINAPLVIVGGSFVFHGGTVLGSPTVRSAAIDLSGTGPIDLIAEGNCNYAGDIDPNQSLTIQGSNSVGSASLTAAAGFANGGLLRLSADAAWSVAATIQSGSLLNAGRIEVLAGGGGSRQLAGTVVNQGTVVLDGVAATIGALSNTGLLDVIGGKNLTISDQFLQTAAGTLRVDFGGPTPGDFTQLSVGTAAVLDGSLEIEHINLFEPALEDTIDLILAGSVPITSAFSSISGDGDYGAIYGPDVVTLTREDGPCPTRLDGDIDGDGDVDLNELAIVLANFGRTCP